MKNKYNFGLDWYNLSWKYIKPPFQGAESHSSVGSVADLRTGGLWFDRQLDRYSFRGLMIVIATGFIPLLSLSVVSTKVKWESTQWLGKKIVRSTAKLKELHESMDKCTGRSDITEILLNSIQQTNSFHGGLFASC